jgi:hypothetical protein
VPGAGVGYMHHSLPPVICVNAVNMFGVMHYLTGNGRLTFHIDKTEIEIIDLNYEDYH